jgi:hypothetical protein
MFPHVPWRSQPTLRLIKPGTAGGREMEVESVTLLGFEPFLDHRALLAASEEIAPRT